MLWGGGGNLPIGLEAGWAAEQVWKSGKEKISGICQESNQDLLFVPFVACSLCWSRHSSFLRDCKLSQLFSRLQLKCDGIQRSKGGEVKGKLANGVGNQYPSHYLGT